VRVTSVVFGAAETLLLGSFDATGTITKPPGWYDQVRGFADP
jgi:hypothetical protein